MDKILYVCSTLCVCVCFVCVCVCVCVCVFCVCTHTHIYAYTHRKHLQLINSYQLVRNEVAADSDEVVALVHPSPVESVELHAPSPYLPTSAAVEDVVLIRIE